MNILGHHILLGLIPTVVLTHLYWAPYTKVEESFNIQAVHDLLIHGIPFKNAYERLSADFDHVSFPGSVPRTFVGALLLSEASRPIAAMTSSTEHQQIVVRGLLGICNSFALLWLKDAVDQAFGRVAGYWYILLQASQFHVMYYASRTLPNMFAFCLSTIALRFVILSNFGSRTRRAKRCKLVVYLFTAAGVIFRSEIAILLATHTASFILFKRVSLERTILPAGILAATLALLITVSVDSFFWQKFPLWPEWVGFRYNTLQGKSSEWGTSPFYFYFLNSLPRLMLNPLALFLCVPLALTSQPTRRFSLELLGPLLAYIAIYSLLPHKEWRFIVYTIPGITAVGSAGASWIWIRRSKTLVYRMLSVALIASVLFSFLISVTLLAVSTFNYPGAVALNKLHQRGHGSKGLISVHLDNLSCQTGITRFLEKPLSSSITEDEMKTTWLYDKTDDQDRLLSPEFWERFDYAISEDPKRVIGKWEIIEVIRGFSGIEITRNQAGPRPSDGLLADQKNASKVLNEVHSLLESTERWIRLRLTNGRWPSVKMEPKMYLLKRQVTDYKSQAVPL